MKLGVGRAASDAHVLRQRDYVAKIKLRGKTSAHSKVEDIMTATPQCASPSFTLDDVLQLFTTYGCARGSSVCPGPSH